MIMARCSSEQVIIGDRRGESHLAVAAVLGPRAG